MAGDCGWGRCVDCCGVLWFLELPDAAMAGPEGVPGLVCGFKGESLPKLVSVLHKEFG